MAKKCKKKMQFGGDVLSEIARSGVLSAAPDIGEDIGSLLTKSPKKTADEKEAIKSKIKKLRNQSIGVGLGGVAAGLAGGVVPGLVAAGKLVGNVVKSKKLKEELEEIEDKEETENVLAAQSFSESGSFKYGGKIKKQKGGKVVGKGTGKSDSIDASLKENSFVIPADAPKDIVKSLSKELNIEGIADLDDGDIDVMLSNGEILVPPEKVSKADKFLKINGYKNGLNDLAPNAEDSYEKSNGGDLEKSSTYADKTLKSEQKSIYVKYKRPQDKKPFHVVPRSEKNLASDKVFQVGKDALNTPIMGTYLDPSNTKELDFEPVVATYFKDKDTYEIPHPSPELSKYLVDVDKMKEGGLTKNKAREMLKHGRVRGKELTEKQRNYFGAIAGDVNKKRMSTAGLVTDKEDEMELQPWMMDVDNFMHSGSMLKKKSIGIDDVSSLEYPGSSEKGSYMEKILSGIEGVDTGVVLGAGQALTGMVGLGKMGERPKPTVSNELKKMAIETQNEAAYGLKPGIKESAKEDVERGRISSTRTIARLSGGSSGTALANIVQAQRQADKSNLMIEVQDQIERDRKKATARNVQSTISKRKDYIENVSMSQYDKEQAAFAELVNAGVSNIVGARKYKNILDQIGQRKEMTSGVLQDLLK